MSEQPEGVDQQLGAGVGESPPVAPGADAAADADPAQDREEYGRTVQEKADESTAPEPPD